MNGINYLMQFDMFARDIRGRSWMNATLHAGYPAQHTNSGENWIVFGHVRGWTGLTTGTGK
jgi:hypothetical protein